MKGTCKHGTFDLAEGCQQCIEERRGMGPFAKSLMPQTGVAKSQPKQLVKVQYFSESTGEISPQEYTYYSERPLEVGYIVSVPVRDSITKAKVSAINVPESEVAAFKDKVKTILANAPKAKPEEAEIPKAADLAPEDTALANLAAVSDAIIEATGNTVAEVAEAAQQLRRISRSGASGRG